jgi:hypothetical protein
MSTTKKSTKQALSKLNEQAMKWKEYEAEIDI